MADPTSAAAAPAAGEQTEEQLWQSVADEIRTGESPPPAPAADTTAVVEAPAPTTPPAPTVSPLELQIQEMAAQLSEQANLLRTANGRIGALQSVIDKQRTSAPAPAPVAEIARPDKWDALRNEYPEMGAAVEELVKANVKTAPVEQAQPLAVDDVLAIVDASETAKQKSRVEAAFPGWEARVKTPAFQQWKQAQPPEVQALGASPYADDAIDLLRKFDEHVRSPRAITETRQEVLQSAARDRPGVPARRDELAGGGPVALTDAQVWAEEAKARAESRRKAAEAY